MAVWRRRQLDMYFARGLQESRATLHLAVRLAMRANQVLTISGSAAEAAGVWRAALPAFVVLDVFIWRALRRSHSFGVGWRLPIDVLDAAFWALSPAPPSGHLGFNSFVLLPLAVEAGCRWRLGGMVVPVAHGAAVRAVRSLDPRPLFALGLCSNVVSVIMGMALWRYCERLYEQARTDHGHLAAANESRSFLAGQNSIAMGSSSVIDVMETLVPLLGRPSKGSALSLLAEGWKAHLSEPTSTEAVYLQSTLLEWERQHNRHPDLAGLVEVYIPLGEGTSLLTGSQAALLWRVLTVSNLAGRYACTCPATTASDCSARSFTLP